MRHVSGLGAVAPHSPSNVTTAFIVMAVAVNSRAWPVPGLRRDHVIPLE